MKRECCLNCRFWSEKIVRSMGCSAIQAMCLADHGSFFEDYTHASDVCEVFKPGIPVDSTFPNSYLDNSSEDGE